MTEQNKTATSGQPEANIYDEIRREVRDKYDEERKRRDRAEEMLELRRHDSGMVRHSR